MHYEVHILGRWLRAEHTGCGYFVAIRKGAAGSLGLMIPPGRMARRLLEGTAREIPEPEPPRPVACVNPYVGRVLDACSVSRVLIDPSTQPSEAA